MTSPHDRFTVFIKNCFSVHDPRHYVVFAALPEINNRTRPASPTSILRTVCYTPPAAVSFNGQEAFTTQKQYFAIIGDLQPGDPRNSIHVLNTFAVHLGSPGAGDGSVVKAQYNESGTATLASARDDSSNPLGTQNPSRFQAVAPLGTSLTGTFTIACVDDPQAPRHNLVVGIGEYIGHQVVVLAAVSYLFGAEYVIRPRDGFLIKQIEAGVGEVVHDAAQDSFGLFFGTGRTVTMSEIPPGHIVPDPYSGATSPSAQQLDTALPDWEPRRYGSLPGDELRRRYTTPPVTSRAATTSRAPAPNSSPPRQPLPAITSSPSTASPRSQPHASPPPPARPQQIPRREQSGSGGEDKLKLLQAYDTVLLIDDSGSMYGWPTSLWSEVEQLLSQLAPIITQYDEDGIDLYFLNHKTDTKPEAYGIWGRAKGGYFGIKDEAKVNEIFRSREEPLGSAPTPTGNRLDFILKAYLDYYEKMHKLGQQDDVKPLNIIVITDGDADDDVEDVIVSAAKSLHEWRAPLNQVGIQFFQIGNDERAREDLNRLDNELKKTHGIRDMVDTVSWDQWDPNNPDKGPSLSANSILKVVLGAVNRKLDRAG